MKSPTPLVIGLAVGALVASISMGLWRSKEQAQAEAEVRELKQSLSQVEMEATEAREALRSATDSREREAARGASSSTPETVPKNPTPAATGTTVTAPASTTSNAMIMGYLGEAVPAPANLDPKYNPQQLAATFRGLCEAQGVQVGKLGVDGTEFPFVLHGLLEGEKARDFFQRIDAELRALPGYTYGGSVTGRTTEGGLHFSLNMTPSSAFPREQADAIRKRLMLRLQMIDAAWVEVVR